MSDVDKKETGLASGMLTTSFVIGGALGLAMLGSLADMRTYELQRSGVSAITALSRGYQFSFLVGALLVTIAAAVSRLALRPIARTDAAEPISAASG